MKRLFFLALLLSALLATSASSQQSNSGQSNSGQSTPQPNSQQTGQTPANSLPSSGGSNSASPSHPQSNADKNPIESPQKSTAEKAADSAHDYTKESFVIEKMSSHYRFESDGTGRKELIARVRVQSEAGVQQWGQLQVGYNSANERVEIPYVRVLKEDGTVIKAGDDAVQDLSAPVEHEAPVYTDYRQKHITVPGLRPGEVLEYDLVTVIHTALAAGQFWTEYEFDKSSIILDETVDVDVPANRPLKLKSKTGMDPTVREENGRRIYHWSSSHLEREDDKADKDKKKKKHRPDDDRPDIQLTTFESWEQIGRWYAQLEKDRRMPTPEVRAKADELTKGYTGEMDKIQALYDYVAKNFRYVSLSLGVGRYQPHASSDVLHNQYGDCKDKHTLLASMLEAEGLHASSVLINSSRKLDVDVPSPSQFDHVITMLPIGSGSKPEEVWMDTTAEVAPFRLLAFTLRDKQALVIPPAELGPSAVPHLEETPADTPMPDMEASEIDGKINDIGKLDAHVHYEFRGDEELLLRSVFRRVPQANWQRVVENINAGLGGDITNVKISDPAATREPFTMSYDVAKVNFLDWSKKKTEIILPLVQFSLPDVDDDDTDADSEPLKLGPKAQYSYSIKLDLPAKYTAHAPLAFSLKRDYAAYEAAYKVDGDTFTATRKLVMNQSELPVDRASDYESFRRAVGSDLAQQLAVETATAEAPVPPADMKADDLVDSGRAAMANGNVAVGIALLKRATEVDPKNKVAWNNLGLAYFSERDDAHAIEAFQKQLEVNPYDDYAYNNLGRVYWNERKYDDAVKAFNKQLENNPLDKYAHGNLGAMYAEWHKYDLAVPELEKAASLNPESGELQVTLGDAYLNLGQDDKALATFDHAIELSATPLIWNNIAYQLSLKKSHLDKAQQYAESAVSATSAALRNVSLDRLTQQDLPLVSSLIAYWDTLGWVHFAEGDTTTAEKYVAAAWGLGHHGEVGDHLGQIYEKRGEKDHALRTYALSMSGLRPTPETRDRLAPLVGGDAKVDATVTRYKTELDRLNTIDLGKATQTGNADFFVLLSGGGGSASKVDAVKFVSGDEKLKSFTEALRTADYHLTFPDDTPVKVFRRGTISCSVGGKCEFVMTLPDDVRTVD
jgi:tetratricopeptide (TPR) repeat protein/transglutaminase-like putative cysteine protease